MSYPYELSLDDALYGNPGRDLLQAPTCMLSALPFRKSHVQDQTTAQHITHTCILYELSSLSHP